MLFFSLLIYIIKLNINRKIIITELVSNFSYFISQVRLGNPIRVIA